MYRSSPYKSCIKFCRRSVKRKSVASSDGDASSAKHVRRCERSGCPARAPICFASASERYKILHLMPVDYAISPLDVEL